MHRRGGEVWLETKIKFGLLFLSPLSSPLQDWSKYTQIFSKMVGEHVDSKQLVAAPTAQNRRTDDDYDDQYTDYYQYWVLCHHMMVEIYIKIQINGEDSIFL